MEIAFLSSSNQPWLFDGTFFPSKVGGPPAWLSYSLPPFEQTVCKVCKNQSIFLLQVYAPPKPNPDHAFHRTIFVFICINSSCWKKNISDCICVFRSQLPRTNSFYEPTAPDYYRCPTEESLSLYKLRNKLCVTCGNLGTKCCGRCKAVRYCSVLHQSIHWKKMHKQSCGKEEGSPPQWEIKSDILFPEYLLDSLNIDDSGTSSCSEENGVASEDDAINELGNIDLNEEDLSQIEGLSEAVDDYQFEQFKDAVSSQPMQVLRYHRNGSPLWVSDHNIPDLKLVPPCSQCGGARTFEFQVMPQLLNSLNVDSMEAVGIDWGTICVYTCATDCDIGVRYCEELVYKQDFGS